MPPERRSPPYSGNSQAQFSERLSFEVRGECAMGLLRAQKSPTEARLKIEGETKYDIDIAKKNYYSFFVRKNAAPLPMPLQMHHHSLPWLL